MNMQHPRLTRRAALQAGAIGLLGLGSNHVDALRALAGSAAPRQQAKAVIYIFLSGGLSQLDSFDLKPDAADGIRGEFQPIATRTAGRGRRSAPPSVASMSSVPRRKMSSA